MDNLSGIKNVSTNKQDTCTESTISIGLEAAQFLNMEVKQQSNCKKRIKSRYQDREEYEKKRKEDNRLSAMRSRDRMKKRVKLLEEDNQKLSDKVKYLESRLDEKNKNLEKAIEERDSFKKLYFSTFEKIKS